MKERPVIFNGEMVRAILDGRKTQTRRVINPQPTLSDRTGFNWNGAAYGIGSTYRDTVRNFANCFKVCPFGQVGDRLWVRETFMELTGTGIEATTGMFEGFAYRADTPAGSYGDEVRKEYGLKWTPSLHMPRKACRILLEITAVRVERLNNISEEDSRAEGVMPMPGAAERLVGGKLAFAELWASIYGYESWRANPWVWVIEFRRVEGA